MKEEKIKFTHYPYQTHLINDNSRSPEELQEMANNLIIDDKLYPGPSLSVDQLPLLKVEGGLYDSTMKPISTDIGSDSGCVQIGDKFYSKNALKVSPEEVKKAFGKTGIKPLNKFIDAIAEEVSLLNPDPDLVFSAEILGRRIMVGSIIGLLDDFEDVCIYRDNEELIDTWTDPKDKNYNLFKLISMDILKSFVKKIGTGELGQVVIYI